MVLFNEASHGCINLGRFFALSQRLAHSRKRDSRMVEDVMRGHSRKRVERKIIS